MLTPTARAAAGALLLAFAAPAAASENRGAGALEPDAPASTEEGQATATLAIRLNEEIVSLAVKVRSRSGAISERDMVVTLYKPTGDGPFPVMIFNHGRNPQTRDSFGRMRALPFAEVMVRRGFAVVMPTRLGYGDSGSDIDPERSAGKSCEQADYTPLMEAHAAQMKVVHTWLAGQPWADASRIVLAGASAGGVGSVTSAGRGLPGIVGVINFAGGIGGVRDERRRGRPCNPANVEEKYAAAGRSSHVPMLWIYAENDALWGDKVPREWHKAFVEAGGEAELHVLPPLGDDGHDILVPGFRYWRPIVDGYLERLGFEAPRSRTALAGTGFADIEDESKVPITVKQLQAGAWRRFLSRDVPRAFVVAPNGGWAMHAGDQDALEKALAHCKRLARKSCKPYAVDDQVVWTP